MSPDENCKHVFSNLKIVKHKTSPKELYMQFIEDLQDAMEKQIAYSKARNQLIIQLAQDNPNEDCRKAIYLLSKENLSLEEMINACAKVGTESYNMDLLANSLTSAVRLTLHWYRCGQQGHRKANCPHKSILLGHFKDRRV